ncbi:MAG: hypothetical protein JJ902_21550 [Roseibium sp.]|nr:hypothetical protein [Roseibium sp.]
MNVSPGSFERQFRRLLDECAPVVRSDRATALGLADLFRFTFEPGDQARTLLHALQNMLLGETIRHARANTVFYAGPDYADGSERQLFRAPDLTCWPVLNRQTIIDNFNDFMSASATFSSACHTSGATGPSLSIYKSTEELSFLWQFYQRLMKPALSGEHPRPLMLSFPNLYHGVAVRLPSHGKVFVSGVTDDLLIEDAVKVLQKTYAIPGHDSRISVLSGLSYQIEFFTHYLLEQGYDPKEFGIKSINVVGNYTPDYCKTFLTDAWDAILCERFTLTESAGGALRCFKCGHYHLDCHVVGEVVDPDDARPIEAGIGHLLLTQLYPFVQMQPLIRYVTGDLVRRIDSDCSNGLTFDFLGKSVNCISLKVDGAAHWVLFPADLYEIINTIPDIRLFENFPTVTRAHDRTVGSPPIYTQTVSEPDDGPMTIELTFELRYAPQRYADRAETLRRQIINGLRSAQTDLARFMDQGLVVLTVRFVGPGALGNAIRMKI